MWVSNKQSKITAATIDGYSKNKNYTETFFHYPTRNTHCQLQYQNKMNNHKFKTFRVKGKSQYQGHLYNSSLNPFPSRHAHYQQPVITTGDRKKAVSFYSNKPTNPVTLKYQPLSRQPKINNGYTPSNTYKIQVQKRQYLPATRQVSKSNKLYHSQIGFSLQARKSITPRPTLNNSSMMKGTIQYQDNQSMNRSTCFDNFKYYSKK